MAYCALSDYSGSVSREAGVGSAHDGGAATGARLRAMEPQSIDGRLKKGKRVNEKVNLAEKLALFSDHWAPRTVASFNEYDIMVVKVQGEFVWHKHDETDDFFLVLKGRLTIRLRDRDVVL